MSDRFSSCKEAIHDTPENVTFIKLKITKSQLDVQDGDTTSLK
jgi:hypothetical protein